ncbi:hypothetical protein ABBQ32_000437 [Trebouxia sp. C0010 RCD-2024]
MGAIEQVPRYTISHTDDGTQERLQLTVSLPGLTSAKDFEVRIEHDSFILRAEGRYNLTLPLHPPVEETAEVLQFVKRKALLKAELKVLSASDQAARSASPVSPSRPAASPSFASRSNQGNGVRKASSTSAQPKSRGAQAAASHTGPFRGQHEDARAPDPDSDVDCCPDLLSNETDASPEASPTHADGAPSSASGQSTSTSHAPTHGPFYERPPDSDESDTSPRVRHWPNQTSPPSAIGRAAHAAMRGNPLYGVSPASQESHADAESSVAESADEQEDSGSQDSYRYLQQPQTKQSLDLAAAYFQQAFVLFYRRDWEQAAKLLFEAQQIDTTTSKLLLLGIGGVPASLAADIRHYVGAFLIRKVEKRMQPDGSGTAKTHKGAWQQAQAVLLLQAIGHPAAKLFGLPPGHVAAAEAQASPYARAALAVGPHLRSEKDEPCNDQRCNATSVFPCVHFSCSVVWLLGDIKGIYITGLTADRNVLVQSNAEQQRTASRQPSQASGLPQFQPDTARSGNRKRSAAAWPSDATASQDDQGTSGNETLDQKQEQQEQQQQQFFQGVRGQRVQLPTPASYGPAEQAEAKRQANKEAALTWLDKAKAAAASKDWNAAVKKAQRGLSLDLDADWASEAHSLIQSWQAAETKQAGGSGSSNPDDKQTGSSKPHTQGRQGQQKQQQQTKKQPKKYKQQSQQQQQQAKHQQPEQPEQRQEQEQPSTSRPQENFKAAGGSPDASYGPGSAPHGQYSYVYGPQGQRTQSAAPGTSDLSAAHHEWLSAVLLPMMMHAAGGVGRGCRWLLHVLAKGMLYAAAAVVLCILLVPQITAGVLYVVGRREWCYQLDDAKKAGKVWAKLVYYVVSPLLAVAAMCTVFCLLYKGTFAGSAAMIASWVAWPLVTVWTQLKSAMGWLHPGRVWIHVIMLIARILSKPRWVRLLSSGLLLWCSLSGRWAIGTTLLASAVSAVLCYDTIGTPVATKLTQVALNNTYITGSFYRGVMVVVIFGFWLFWQAVMKESLNTAQAESPPEPTPGTALLHRHHIFTSPICLK